MSPELQEKLFKIGGVLVQVALLMACSKWFPNDPLLTGVIMSLTGSAYGGLAYNTPVRAVRKAQGLVSIRAPSPDDEAEMRAAIQFIDSSRPPPPAPLEGKKKP